MLPIVEILSQDPVQRIVTPLRVTRLVGGWVVRSMFESSGGVSTMERPREEARFYFNNDELS